jgi:hypothetical protein
MNRRMFWFRELRVGGGVASSLVDGGGCAVVFAYAVLSYIAWKTQQRRREG